MGMRSLFAVRRVPGFLGSHVVFPVCYFSHHAYTPTRLQHCWTTIVKDIFFWWSLMLSYFSYVAWLGYSMECRLGDSTSQSS